MKKSIMYFIAVIVSVIVTLVFFELMSWYHFGDIPTKVVLVRLIAFFCIVSGMLISIVALINKKKDKSKFINTIKNILEQETANNEKK